MHKKPPIHVHANADGYSRPRSAVTCRLCKRLMLCRAWADPGGGGGAGTGRPDHPKNHKNRGFLSNTGPDPLKKKQSYQAHLIGVSLAGR